MKASVVVSTWKTHVSAAEAARHIAVKTQRHTVDDSTNGLVSCVNYSHSSCVESSS